MISSLREGEKVVLETSPEIKSSALGFMTISFLGMVAGLITVLYSGSMADLLGISSTSLTALGGTILSFGLIGLVATPVVITGTTYYLTDRRVMSEFDFALTRVSIVSYDNVTNSHPRQGIFDRIFGTGSVGIHTAGSNRKAVRISWTNDFSEAESILSNQIHRSRGGRDTY